MQKGGQTMEGYLSIREAAEKWGVSERRVNQYCTEGRIPGAQRFGTSWVIPISAEKPGDPRKKKTTSFSLEQQKQPELFQGFMPLMCTAFQPGTCMKTIEKMPNQIQKEIALTEYYYFSGQAEKAMQKAELYLTHPEVPYRFSSCLIYAYACLSVGQISHALYALNEINKTLEEGKQQASHVLAIESFVATASAVLLHLPLPEKIPPLEKFLPLLPSGLRAFAMYVLAHYLYLKEEYGYSAGIVEATLSMGGNAYPIPAIYLHLVAVMDYMSLRNREKAEFHMLEAWKTACPDNLIEGLGEHHGLLGGMLEAVIKPNWPEDFKRIIDITYRFSSGWRRVHNPITGHDVADDLTTTEFAVAMLNARGWTHQEIAKHMNISVNTVKSHLTQVKKKLNVKNRKELEKYMLL